MIKAGTYHKIPLTDVIFEAKKYLLLDNQSADDDFLELIAWRTIKRMNAISSYITEVREVEVCNGEAQLPGSLYRFLWFRVCEPVSNQFDLDGTISTTPSVNGLGYIYADIPFLNSCGCAVDGETTGDIQAYPNTVRINDGKLVFSFGNDLHFDKVHIAGIYYNTDENGVFVVNDNAVQAIVYGICADYTLVHTGKYKPMQASEYRRLYTAAANKVRSNDFHINFQNNIDQIASMYRGYNYAPLISRNRSRY